MNASVGIDLNAKNDTLNHGLVFLYLSLMQIETIIENFRYFVKVIYWETI